MPLQYFRRPFAATTKMGKKAAPKAQYPLKPLHVVSPAVAYGDRPCGDEFEYEYDTLLARSRVGGGPVRPLPLRQPDLELGNGVAAPSTSSGPDGNWQVVRALDGLICIATRHVLELVQLNGANFGCRWRAVNLKQDGDVPPPRCMMGPHWHLMMATWSVLCFLSSVVTLLTLPKAGVVELSAGVLLSGACLTFYALVGCSNPGIVRRISIPPDDTYTYCDHCESYRPEGALHCMDCRVCIEEYDHHCPWTGKCVGKGNVRYFYLWLLFLVLAFVYEVIEFTTYLLPPDGQPNLLDSSDDSLEIIFPTPSYQPPP